MLPADAPAEALPEGLRPVGTLPLRRAIAADWCAELLRLRGVKPAGARILVTAGALSGEVVRTVTELALRHRYLLLEVPFGGEELCRRLRREYGVSVLLHPGAEEAAAVQIAFDPAVSRGESFLPLYDEALPLPRLLLPPEVERIVTRRAPPEERMAQLHATDLGRRFSLLPFCSIGAPEGLLLAVCSDSVQIGGTTYPRTLVALSPGPVSDGGGYQALWGGTEGRKHEKAVQAAAGVAAQSAQAG